MLMNVERAKAVMDKHGIDALVATAPENVYYLSDYGFSHLFHFAHYGVAAAIFPRHESIPPTLILADVIVPYLEVNPTWMPEVRMMGSFGTPLRGGDLSEVEQRVIARWKALDAKGPGSPNRQKVVASTLKEMGLAKASLAFDDPRAMLELQGLGIGGQGSREAINLFREIRLVKTPEEVELMRKAADINQCALRMASNLLRDGVTMREMRSAWRSSVVLQDAVPTVFYAGGFDRPWPYADDRYRLKNGDHCLLDCTLTYKWYWADMGRTGAVGSPSAKVEQIHGELQQIHQAIVPMLKSGISTADIKAAARDVAPASISDCLMTLMHPLGLEIYEMPQPYGEIEREDVVVETGMVINFECALYWEFPWGVVQIEDTFLVEDGGVRQLTTLPATILGPDTKSAALPPAGR